MVALDLPRRIGGHIEGRRLIGYGAGLALLNTLRVLPLDLDFVVDDGPGMAGESIRGIPIRPTSALGDVDKNKYFVIIFTYRPRSALAIQRRLDALGFEYLDDYADASLLQYEPMARRLGERLGSEPSPRLFAETRLLTLYGALDNFTGVAGSWLFQELLRGRAGVPGDVAELGVYKGGNAFIALTLSGDAFRGRALHLFDSFEGFPEFSAHDPSSRAGEFADTSVADVRDAFRNFEDVRIHPGYFPASLVAAESSRFALVHVDCDLYEPTLQSCGFFYERMSPGGVMLFHDYGDPETDLPPGRGPRSPGSSGPSASSSPTSPRSRSSSPSRRTPWSSSARAARRVVAERVDDPARRLGLQRLAVADAAEDGDGLQAQGLPRAGCRPRYRRRSSGRAGRGRRREQVRLDPPALSPAGAGRQDVVEERPEAEPIELLGEEVRPLPERHEHERPQAAQRLQRLQAPAIGVSRPRNSRDSIRRASRGDRPPHRDRSRRSPRTARRVDRRRRFNSQKPTGRTAGSPKSRSKARWT